MQNGRRGMFFQSHYLPTQWRDVPNKNFTLHRTNWPKWIKNVLFDASRCGYLDVDNTDHTITSDDEEITRYGTPDLDESLTDGDSDGIHAYERLIVPFHALRILSKTKRILI
jgi:hypothetical protein